MKTGKFQMVVSKKKGNFNEIIGNNSKRYQQKNIKRLGGNEYYQISKSSNINVTKNSQLKQYIDMTVTHFSVKCSLLCNEIEEMKREFITQLQGIIEGFSFNQPNYPIIKGGFNKNFNFGQNLKFNKLNLDNGYVSTNINENNKMIYTNNKDKYYINNNDAFEHYFEKNGRKGNSEINNLYSEKLFEENSCNKININNINNSRNLSLHKKEKSIPQIKSIHKIKIITNKEKALRILMKSKVLSFDDKLKIKTLNHSLFNDFDTKNILNTCKKDYEKQLKKINSDNLDLPSLTSTSVLNFLTKEKENELKDESNEINKKFLNMLFILSDKKNNENSSLENKYNDLCNEFKVDSIKNLIINYLKTIKDNIKNVNNDIINNFNNYLENNKELIEQNDNQNQLISLFSFSIKELYEIFKFEIGKRKKIKVYEKLLCDIKSLEKKIK